MIITKKAKNHTIFKVINKLHSLSQTNHVDFLLVTKESGPITIQNSKYFSNNQKKLIKDIIEDNLEQNNSVFLDIKPFLKDSYRIRLFALRTSAGQKLGLLEPLGNELDHNVRDDDYTEDGDEDSGPRTRIKDEPKEEFELDPPELGKDFPELATDNYDDSQLYHQYCQIFHTLTQVVCKTVAKEWIKVIEPRKQALYPYKFNRKPAWWPKCVPHVEPDHLDKDNRIRLLVNILRYPPVNLIHLKKASNLINSSFTYIHNLLYELFYLAFYERFFFKYGMENNQELYQELSATDKHYLDQDTLHLAVSDLTSSNKGLMVSRVTTDMINHESYSLREFNGVNFYDEENEEKSHNITDSSETSDENDETESSTFFFQEESLTPVSSTAGDNSLKKCFELNINQSYEDNYHEMMEASCSDSLEFSFDTNFS